MASPPDRDQTSAEIIDISVSLYAGMPTWPGSGGFRRVQTHSMANGDEADVSVLECDVHTGTHVDAPSHFVPGGPSVETLALDLLIGPAHVVDLRGQPALTPEALERAGIPDGAVRVLFRTDNSARWSQRGAAFYSDFVAFTAEGAKWIVDRGVRLVGVDYLSVQRFNDPPDTHRILLGAGLVAIEGLDLSRAIPGRYELLCLPLKLEGAEGAPARCVLRATAVGSKR